MRTREQREHQVFEYVRKIIEKEGYPPTIREIMKACNISSTSSVHQSLTDLEYHGYIKREERSPRAIKIVKK